MTDKWYLETPGAAMCRDEREWIRTATAEVAGRTEDPQIVHIGVEMGASLHCSLAGAPGVVVVGVDLDVGKFRPGTTSEESFELIEGDSRIVHEQVRGDVHFLFVDGDHRQPSVMADMANWLPKVPVGGVVGFHDYGNYMLEWCKGVKAAVDGWNWSGWEEVPAAGSIRAFRRVAEGGSGRPLLYGSDPFGRIGFGVPYFRPNYAFWMWWSGLLMEGFEPGDVFLNDDNVPGEVSIPVAHNALVRSFLETECDTLLIIEDDHEGPVEIVRDMRFKAENWEYDVVCASYVNRRGVPRAIGGTFTGERNARGWQVHRDMREVASSGTQQVDVAALGLVFIRRWVVEAMLRDGDPAQTFWFEWAGANSQDITFYAECKRMGARVGVDRDHWLEHWGQTSWGKADFEAWLQLAARAHAGEAVPERPVFPGKYGRP